MLIMCQMKLFALDWVVLDSLLQIEPEKEGKNHASVPLHIVQRLGYDVRHFCLGHSIYGPLLCFSEGPVPVILPRDSTTGTIPLKAEGCKAPTTFEAILF